MENLVPMKSFHVLAKITSEDTAEQRHFFIRHVDEGKAINAVRHNIPCAEDSDIQFTIKEAKHLSSTPEDGGFVEIFSL